MTIAIAKRNEYFEAQSIPFMNYKHYKNNKKSPVFEP